MRRSGLGKGLGALIPPDQVADSSSEPVGGTALREIPVSQISPNARQPRGHFDEEALLSLTASVQEVGVLQPVLVRPAADDPERFELIAGERRWRAAKRAGLQTVPAMVRDAEDARALEHALVENLHREDLNVLEEAAAYQQLIEDFELTHDDVARQVGKSRSAVSNSLRLLHLPPAIQRMVQEATLTGGHARALLGTPDRAFQEALARKAVAEDLSVRQVEQAVRERQGEGGSKPEPRPRKSRLRPPGLLELEELLSSRLDTRVKVSMGAKKGRVVIDFATLEDLERIYRVMTEPENDTD